MLAPYKNVKPEPVNAKPTPVNKQVKKLIFMITGLEKNLGTYKSEDPG